MRVEPGTRAFLVLLALCVMLGPVSTDMYLASLPDMAVFFGATPSAVQLTLAAYMIGFAIGNLLHGPLGDRYGRRPVMLGGLAVFTVMSLVCVIAPTIEIMIAARFLQAVSGCAPIVMARAVVRDAYPPERAGIVFSMMGMITGLAPILAPMLGGVLHSAFGWQSNFIAMGAFAVAIATLVFFQFQETLNPAHRQAIRPLYIARNFGVLLKNPLFRGYTNIVGAAFSGIFAFLSGAAFVYQGVFGLTPGQFGFLFGAITAGFLIGNVIGVRLTPKFGPAAMLHAGTVILAVSGLAMAALALAGVNRLWAMALPQWLYVLGMGLVMPHGFAAALTPFPQMAGTASSLLGFLQISAAVIVGTGMTLFLDPEPGPGAQIPLAVTIGLTGTITWIFHRSVVRFERSTGRRV